MIKSNFNIFSTAIFEIISTQNKLEIRSNLLRDCETTIEFKEIIKRTCASNVDSLMILCNDGSLNRYDIATKVLEQIFIQSANETVIDICCSQSSLYCVTSRSRLYQITSGEQIEMHEFPKHQKIKKMIAGAEHVLVLSSNGDVFSLGCGLRGALGHGDVASYETPKQIEALAGLKIIDIAAGSFHSIAVSSFGDIYTWGWNTNGQLGLPKVAQHTFDNISKSHQQVFSIPQLIDLEDDDEAIKSVYCGAKHTVLRTESNRIFVSGLNNFGQLGLSSSKQDIDSFTEVPIKGVDDKAKIFCGFWSTYLLDTR